MAAIERAGRRVERLVARYFDAPLPPTEDLPRYVAPLPGWLEDLGLRLAWPIAIVNLLGTMFGFWYYGFHPFPLSDPLITGQLARAPEAMWLFVPDSPVATLFIALSLIAWARGWNAEWIHALAFFGCIKLGLWTPWVQLVINGLGDTPVWMFHFLVWSHMAMAVEAFLIHRYSDFSVGAIAFALGWYLLNDVVDYFVPLVGEPHHTTIVAEWTGTTLQHASQAHNLAAAAAVVLTVIATFLALSTRLEKVKRRL